MEWKNRDDENSFAWAPVEWKASLELESDPNRKVCLAFCINVDNPVEYMVKGSTVIKGPMEAHIGYKCTATGSTSINGHHLLNEQPRLPGRNRVLGQVASSKELEKKVKLKDDWLEKDPLSDLASHDDFDCIIHQDWARSRSGNIILEVEEKDKRSRILKLLCDEEFKLFIKAMVFVETKECATDLTYDLKKEGFGVVAIHGDVNQNRRKANLENFRSGKANVMVATSEAIPDVRDWDIPDVQHVINYDLPNDIDKYLHCIGYTGNIGASTSFFNKKNQRLASGLRKVLLDRKEECPEFLKRY